MKKILHLLSSNSYSGAENVCVNIIRLSSHLYECVYCSPVGQIKNKLTDGNINYYGINRMTLQEVRRAIADVKPDLIHAHDIRASVYAAICSSGIPVVSQIHARFPEMSRLSMKSIIYYLCSKRFSKILYVSRSIYRDFYFKDILDKKGILFQNQLDEEAVRERLLSIKEFANYDFAFIGRLESVKNPIRYITLINKLQKIYPDIKCCIVGAGSLKEECKNAIEENNVNVDLLGYQNEPLKYLKKAKALVITSVVEGLPMVALEAMACMVPIISTPVDGIVDLLSDKKDGFICNSDDDFLNAMKSAMENGADYRKVLNAVETRSSNYEEYKSRILSVYHELIG